VANPPAVKGVRDLEILHRIRHKALGGDDKEGKGGKQVNNWFNLNLLAPDTPAVRDVTPPKPRRGDG